MVATFYLDPKRINPGDILLTLAPRARSKVVAALAEKRSSGPLATARFSHAAVFLTARTLLESDGFGVGPRHLLPLEFAVGGGERTLIDLGRQRHVAILRHKDMTLDCVEVESRLRTFAETVVGRAYPPVGRLTPAIFGTRESWVAKLVSRLLPDAHDPFVDNVGIFCSELVVLAYSSLGYELFEGSVADEISPNRLSSCSLLEEVPFVVLKHSTRLKLAVTADRENAIDKTEKDALAALESAMLEVERAFEDLDGRKRLGIGVLTRRSGSRAARRLASTFPETENELRKQGQHSCWFVPIVGEWVAGVASPERDGVALRSIQCPGCRAPALDSAGLDIFRRQYFVCGRCGGVWVIWLAENKAHVRSSLLRSAPGDAVSMLVHPLDGSNEGARSTCVRPEN